MLRFLFVIIICAFSTVSIFSTSVVAAEAKNPQLEYSRALMEHLKQNWNFQVTPEHFKDSVTIKLKIDREGNLAEATILEHALSSSLDTEALKQLSAMQPFPKMSAEIDEKAAFVEFPYQFSPTSIAVSLTDKDKYLKEIDSQPEPKQ